MHIGNRKWLSGLITVLILVMVICPAAQALAAPPPMVKVIIGFNQQSALSARQSLVASVGGQIKQAYHLVAAVAASIPENRVDALRHNALVSYVEEDGTVQAIDATIPWGIRQIGADSVHAYNQGSGVKVAIIDTGIDLNQTDLKVAGNVTFVAGTSSGQDDNGHGTHVAGTVAALGNGTGVVGVAPGAALYAVKVLDRNGSGSISGVVSGIQWAVTNKMQVINMSLGTSSDYTTLHTACDAAYAAGIVIVAAAGNSGNSYGTGVNVLYPAAYDSVIAVAATDSTNSRASFSSTGPKVELAAPGVNVLSTCLGGSYCTMSGTSMASPHVAGVAALVIASGIVKDTDGKDGIADEVRQRLDSTAEDLGAAGRDSLYGYGLVYAPAAAPQTDIPPVAKAGPDQVVSDSTNVGSVSVTLNGSGSYDPDGSIVSWAWSEGATPLGSGQTLAVKFAIGSHTVTLTVTDNGGLTATSNVQITVQPDVAPVANAGPDQVVTDNNCDGVESVTLNGSGSYDSDGSIVSWAWSEGATPLGFGQTLAVTFAVGNQTVTLTVTDNGGLTATSNVQITVQKCPMPAMRVASIGMALTRLYSGLLTYATATVKLVDANGAAVPSATVNGHWQIATTTYPGSNAKTNTGGVVTFTSTMLTKVASGTKFVFVVDQVTKTGWYYNATGSITSNYVSAP